MAYEAADFPGADEPQSSQTPAPPSIWYWVALCVLAAALLLLVSAVFRSYEFDSMTRRKQYAGSRTTASVSSRRASFFAAAVAALQIERARRKTVNLFILGGAILVAAGAVFSIIDMFTIHVPGPNDQESVSFGLNGIKLNPTPSIIVPAIAALLLAAAAIVVARAPSASPEPV